MTKQEIHNMCRDHGITNYTINDDMSVNVYQAVTLKDYPEENYIPVNFNKVEYGFECSFCDIESLKGAPNYIGENFECEGNHIKTFEYFPSVIKESILLSGNEVAELWNLFEDTKHIEYFNELDIIQENGNVIILDRLNYFLTDIGKEEVSKNYIQNYKVI